MAAMLRALPPAIGLRSNTSTSNPRSTSSCAALIPATPPPRITTFLRVPNRHLCNQVMPRGATA